MTNSNVCNCPPKIVVTPCTGICICGISYSTIKEGATGSGIQINRLRFLAQTPAYPEISYIPYTCPEPTLPLDQVDCGCN